MTLQGAMECFGVLELKTPTLRVSFRESESVLITDLSELESRFVRVKTTKEPDKPSIKEAIKNGESVLGAELVTKNNIQIK